MEKLKTPNRETIHDNLQHGSYISGQISIIPKPELRGFWGSSLIKPPFGVTSAEVVIICLDIYIYIHISGGLS